MRIDSLGNVLMDVISSKKAIEQQLTKGVTEYEYKAHSGLANDALTSIPSKPASILKKGMRHCPHSLQGEYLKTVTSAISSIYGRVAEHAHKLALIHALSKHGGKILEKNLIDPLLDFLHNSACHGCRIRKIEAKASGGVLRAHLSGGVSQAFAESTVNQVSSGVSAGNRPTPSNVDLTDH